uniref:Uncharacterized protein n=1 Tax=Hyaloperonospora arabidopsidis (strain Emoy2) TaxID=559515 RepID=M4C4C8_HYAAE
MGAPIGYALLGGSVGGHSINLVESGLITKFLREIVSLNFSLFISGSLPNWPLRCLRTTRWTQSKSARLLV